MTLMEYIQGPLQHGHDETDLPPGGWRQFYEGWLGSNIPYTLVRQEDAIEDKFWVMKDLVIACGVQPDLSRIQKACEKYDNQQRVAYTPQCTSSDPLTTLAGVSEWQEHLTDEEAGAIVAYCGDTMRKFGY
jgi:hypothetical protein